MSELKFRNLRADEIMVRRADESNGKMSLLLYQDARVGMNLLDEVVGREDWSCSYTEQCGLLFCSIGIYSKEHNAFIYKSDCGSEGNFEKEKALSSDAFKRACVRWGIGRSLYTAPKIRVPISNATFYVSEIEYDKNDRISTLVICDWNDEIVFNYVDGKVQPLERAQVDRTEILKAVCGDLKNDDGNDTKELLKFYNYYLDKVYNFDTFTERTVRRLWTKWNERK